EYASKAIALRPVITRTVPFLRSRRRVDQSHSARSVVSCGTPRGYTPSAHAVRRKMEREQRNSGHLSARNVSFNILNDLDFPSNFQIMRCSEEVHSYCSGTPNGLQDVLKASRVPSSLPADVRQRVDSLLNPCNCRSVWKCNCATSGSGSQFHRRGA
ncbi:hypothetical protein Hypma_015070, partial [Hypsizygus marmoreus]